MATFNDLRKVLEDTVRVDMKNRWTPQQVKFINRNNEFFGKFIGKLEATDLSSETAHIISASIDHLVLKDGIDLAQYATYLAQLFDITEELSNNLGPISVDLYNLSSFVCSSLMELSVDLNSVDEKINVEMVNRAEEDTKILKKLDEKVEQLQSKDTEIQNNLNSHIQEQQEETESIKKELREYADMSRSFDIREIELVSEKYQLLDYTANKINDVVPDWFVQDGYGNKIAYVTNVVRTPSEDIYSFTLNILPDAYQKYPSLGTEKHVYFFNQTDTEHKTGVGEFHIRWAFNPGDTIKIYLETPSEKYFNVFKNGILYPVAVINSHTFNELSTGLNSGHITFNSRIPRLNGISYNFNNTDQRTFIDTTKDVRIDYNKGETFDVIEDYSHLIKFHDLKDADETSFGRIISGDVSYGLSGITSIKVSKLGGHNYVINESNGFSTLLEGSETDSVMYRDKKISVVHKEEYYQFALSGYDAQTGTKIQRSAGYLKMKTYNVQDPYLEKTGFEVEITDVEHPECIGTYTLKRVEGSDDEFKGKSEDGKIILKYNKFTSKYLIKIINISEMKEIGYFFVDIGNVSMYHDDNKTVHESSQIVNALGIVEFNDVDTTGADIYSIAFDIKDEKTSEIPQTVEFRNVLGKQFIQIGIPQKVQNGKARVFDLLIEPQSYNFKETSIKIIGDEGCRYFLNGSDVTDVFSFNKARNAYRFIELDDAVDNRQFQILDLNNTEIMDRECVSFMGDLYNIPEDSHLSCYFTQQIEGTENDIMRQGWMYRAAEDTGIMYDTDGISVRLCENDYVIMKHPTVKKFVKVNDFTITRDAQQEVLELSSKVWRTFVKLSGNNNISGFNSIEEVNISTEYVLDSTISNLNVTYAEIDNISVDNLSVGHISAENLSIDSKNLMFTDVVSSMFDIKGDLQGQITANDNDISAISSDIWRTFDAAEGGIPHYLMLKDTEDGVIYKLMISNGVLNVNKVEA